VCAFARNDHLLPTLQRSRTVRRPCSTPSTRRRLDRLQYLVSTLRDGGIKWHTALTMPEADWLDMYSGYKRWWAKVKR